MLSCNTYRLTWVSLTLGMGYLFTAAPAKCSHCSLPWTRGISSLPPFPDLQREIAPLGPPAPAQPPLLGCGVGPPGRHPWPQAWGSSPLLLPLSLDLGSSSRPFLCCLSLAFLAAAPDLRHGVTPLGRRPSGMGSSQEEFSSLKTYINKNIQPKMEMLYMQSAKRKTRS